MTRKRRWNPALAMSAAVLAAGIGTMPAPVTAQLLLEGDVYALYCAGRNDGLRWLDGNLATGAVTLSETGEGTGGTGWRVINIDTMNNVFAFETLGALANGQHRYLECNSQRGTAGLAPDIVAAYTGTSFGVSRQSSGRYVLYCQDGQEGTAYLSGNYRTGAVGLAPEASSVFPSCGFWSLWRVEDEVIDAVSAAPVQGAAPAIAEPAAPPPSGVLIAEKTTLGLVTAASAPDEWTVTIPNNAVRVELGVHGKGNDRIDAYGGWNAEMFVNGRSVWRFLSYDNAKGGRIRDELAGTEVWDSSGYGKWYDITSVVQPGQNTIRFYHYTSGDGFLVEMRVLTPE